VHDALMLIGDPEYYGRFFGFTADRPAAGACPARSKPRRLLARGAGGARLRGMLARACPRA
jgi:predicted N-acetyltransferase YhbS